RLQGRHAAPEVHIRPRQDPRTAGDGQLRPAPARGGLGGEERPGDGAPALHGAMRVILHRAVDKLGVPGQVVDVADGYARNYLIPRGLAAPASKGEVRHSARLKQAHEKRVQEALSEAQATADRLAGAPLRIPARAGEDGRLFGSVTVTDVATA